MSLVYQIQNGLKKNFSESDICDTVINSISSELLLKSYLEGKPDMNIASLSKVRGSYFKEPNSTALFTALSNSRHATNESAQEYVMRLMSLRQKILLVIKEESCSYNEELTQNHFYPCRFDRTSE